MLLAALRAMAIQRRRQLPGDLEFDAAAQAAAVDGGMKGSLLLLKALSLCGEEGFCHDAHSARRCRTKGARCRLYVK